MTMIKFDSVEKYYGKFHALKNINLEFEKGKLSLSLVHQDQEKVRCFAVSTAWKQSLQESF